MRSSSSSSAPKRREAAAVPLSSYEFDFGLGSLQPQGGISLNEQKKGLGAAASGMRHYASADRSASAAGGGAAAAAAPKASWVHKPAAGMARQELKPMGLAGDITGKSWTPMQQPSRAPDAGIVGGIGSAKGDMFGDLLGFKPQGSKGGMSMASVGSALPMNAMKKPESREASDDAKADFFQELWQQSAKKDVHEAEQKKDFPDNLWGKNAKQDPVEVQKPANLAQDGILEDLWVRKSPRKQDPLEGKGNGEDWLNTGEMSATTTELDGLPAPPPGVSAAMAMNKGMQFQKQGQFADAIKWLTWAAALPDGSSLLASILSCRVLCLKEVGEYKKAVKDCTQVLEMDGANTEMLLQRAFLYESMEKYKLGAQDLSELLSRDPSNRVARTTLARLTALVG